MQSMGTLKAVVRGGRAVLVEDRVDLPEGTELELEVHEHVDELDEEELAELDAELEAGQREYEATGETYSAADVLARVRAGR
jgi:predicted DNA-binding antitoxin AbrB/MazE fold protein